jgi:hypothetical protein
MCTISVSRAIRLTRVTRSGNGARRARKFPGASYTKMLEPSLIPSFFASGVPEYPAIISSDELELSVFRDHLLQAMRDETYCNFQIIACTLSSQDRAVAIFRMFYAGA